MARAARDFFAAKKGALLGGARWLDALGVAMAVVVGARLAETKGLAWAAVLSPKLAPDTHDVAFWTLDDPNKPFVTHVVFVALALAVVFGYSLVALAFRHLPKVRVVPPAAMTLVAFSYMRGENAFLRGVAPAVIIFLWAVVQPHVARSDLARPVTARAPAVAYVLFAEVICLAWGAWLSRVTISVNAACAALTAVVAYWVWRVARSLRHGGDSLAREALSSAPMLALPLVGLLREPSAWWCLLAVVLSLALRAALVQRADTRLPNWLVGLAVPLAIGAILVIPLQMRDLPTISHKDHEGQFYGWVESALRGKMMMADASTFYGPARIYLAAAWVLVAGKTVLQMRVAFVLANLVGLALLLRVAFKLVHKNVWVHVWTLVMLLIYTPLWTLLAYKNDISLGWADLARSGWAVLALAFTVDAVARLPRDTMGSRHELARVAAGGALTVFATLYSQEHGACAFGALVLVVTLQRALAHGPGARPRALASLATLGSFLAGFALAAALWLFVYAMKGSARLFLHTLLHVTGLVGSGAWGSTAFPIHESSVESEEALGAVVGYGGGAAWEFMLPTAVYLVAGAALVARLTLGRWTPRASLLLALELYGVASFRVATARSDVYHLVSATAPAVLLVAALTADVIPMALRFGKRHRTAGLGRILAACIMLFSLRLTFFERFVSRIDQIARREEVPSKGPKYEHPGLPRAGDVYVPPPVEELARYVIANTTPDDYVFSRVHGMKGPEYYFLTDRRNPTRYDITVEIATHSMMADALSDLKAHPPKLVIGTHPAGGPEMEAYLKDWKLAATFGDTSVYARE